MFVNLHACTALIMAGATELLNTLVERMSY